jgi:hypothetical protein
VQPPFWRTEPARLVWFRFSRTHPFVRGGRAKRANKNGPLGASQCAKRTLILQLITALAAGPSGGPTGSKLRSWELYQPRAESVVKGLPRDQPLRPQGGDSFIALNCEPTKPHNFFFNDICTTLVSASLPSTRSMSLVATASMII